MTDLLQLPDPRAALAVHLLLAAVAVAAILGVAGLLREPSRPGFGVYESGAPPGPALHGRGAAQFVLVAALFMIFDVEAALLFAWAVAAADLGRQGLVAATIFVAVLLAALAYVWMDGALDTAPRREAP